MITRKALQPRLTRGFQFALDVAMLMLAFVFAYLLRFEFAVPEAEINKAIQQLPYVVLVQLGALALAGVYSFIWRYVGMGEVKAFLYAAIWSALALSVARLTLPERLGGWRVPLSVILMGTVLAFGGVLGLRVVRRYLYEFSQRRKRAVGAVEGENVPTLLVGAGRAGVLAAREITNRGDMNLDVKGFVDDDAEKQGAVVHGIRVLGTTEDLPRLVKELGIEQVVITIAQISRQEILRLIGLCRKIQVAVRIIPGLFEVLQGKVQVTRIRNVQIEDLLGREPVYLDEAQLGSFLAGKRVMVTGAGGTIGSELVPPGRAVPAGEAHARRARRERPVRDRPRAPAVPAGDRDPAARRRRLRRGAHAGALGRARPQVVFHAAAHKHVPMMEGNPGEAIKNNIFGTRLLAELAGRATASRRFVMISTDKAVNPTSVMGATKRVAEIARPGPRPAQRDPLRHGALRQRARLGRQRHPDLPRADRAGAAR